MEQRSSWPWCGHSEAAATPWALLLVSVILSEGGRAWRLYPNLAGQWLGLPQA